MTQADGIVQDGDKLIIDVRKVLKRQDVSDMLGDAIEAQGADEAIAAVARHLPVRFQKHHVAVAFWLTASAIVVLIVVTIIHALLVDGYWGLIESGAVTSGAAIRGLSALMEAAE